MVIVSADVPETMTKKTLIAALLTIATLGLAACGSEEAAPGRTQSAATAPDAAPTTQGEAKSCPDVPVPGHLAEDVMARGLTCDATVPVANMAEGRRRAAYTSDGFSCKPQDAADGKTNYTCTKGSATLTFLYG